jgi:hypothetical protein
MRKLVFLSTIILCAATLSYAKENQAPRRAAATNTTASSASNATNRIGLGFNTQLTNAGISSVSARYWSDDRLGFEGLFGFAFGNDTRYIDLGGKILLGIKKERNLNLYGFGLLGIENWNIDRNGNSTSDTDVTVAGGLGVEFFFEGLPNLGFGTELGLGYNSGSEIFGTRADWIPAVGMRYYF